MPEALVNPYCSVAQVQAELRNTDAALNDALVRAINAASRYIDQYKGRDYFKHDHSSSPVVVDVFSRAVYGQTLYLPFSPIISLSEVKEGGAVLVQDQDYVIRGDSLRRLSGHWSVGEPPDNVIELNGVFGYQQTTSADVPVGIPLTINQAAVLIAAALSGQNSKEVINLDGGKSSVIDKAIPKTAYDLLGSRGITI